MADDARLIHSTALQVAEAALTGESTAVAKEIAAISCSQELSDRTNMVFSGTTAIYGRGRAVVTATGRVSRDVLFADVTLAVYRGKCVVGQSPILFRAVPHPA